MAHFAPPLTFTLTPRQVAWLDGRRHLGCLSRSAALRLALDELILLEGERQVGILGRGAHGPSLQGSHLPAEQPQGEDPRSTANEGCTPTATEASTQPTEVRHG